MSYVKLRARLGADKIRAMMQDRPRRWRWRKALIDLLIVAVIVLLLWIVATDLAGPAIDHELNRMPTAASMVAEYGR